MKIKKIAEAPRILSLENFPLGAIVNYDGELIPEGWERIDAPVISSEYNEKNEELNLLNIEPGEVLNIYSTDEIKIGKWIDGKPLYRKVVKGNLPITNVAGTSARRDFFVADNTEMRRIVGAWVIDSIGDTYPLPHLSGTGQNGYLVKCIFQSTGKLVLENAISAWSELPLIAILEYTKTVDVVKEA